MQSHQRRSHCQLPIIDRTINEDTKQTDGVTRRLRSCGGNDADTWGGSAQAAELPSDFQLDSGSGYVATTDVKLSGAVKVEALAAVKKWRQDALDTNVPWPKYDSKTTIQILATTVLMDRIGLI